jgi:two-component system NtrC family sensor kinase
VDFGSDSDAADCIDKGALASTSLRDTQDALRAIFEGVETGILIIDPENHRIVDANPIALALIGASRAETVGAVCHRFVCPAEHGRCPVTDLGQTVDNSERVLLTASAQRRAIIKTVRPVTMGGHRYLLESFLDITQLKRIEAELRESEDRFRTAFEDAPYGMCMTGLDGHFLHANAALCQMLGYSAQELLAGAWQQITHPDDLERSQQIAFRFSQGLDNTLELEKRYLHKQGHVVWVHVKISLVKDGQGKPSHYITQIADITQRRQADEAKAFLASLVDFSQDAVVGTNPDGIVISWNRGATELYSYSPEEMIGKSAAALVASERIDNLSRILDKVRNGERLSGYETLLIRKDGSHVDVSLAISPVFDTNGNVTGLASIGRDITRRKRAEQALQHSEEKFRQLAENISEVFWIMPPTGNEMLYVSPAYEQVWGRSCEDLYRNPTAWAEAIHPDDQSAARAAFSRQLQGERIDSIYRIHTPDGKQKWIRDRAFPVRDELGRLSRIVGLAEDISARKEADESLRASEERYRELFENASDLVYTFDLDLQITSLNRLAEQVTGYSREEATKMNLRHLLENTQWHRVEQVMAQLLAGLATNKIELEISGKDGRRMKLEMNPRLIYRDGKPVGIQAIARDITGRDAAEMELRQAQKLESVGRLAAGIAHEINTPMQFVGDNVRFLQDAFNDLQGVIREIEGLGQRHDRDAKDLSAELRRLQNDSDWNFLLEEVPKAISQTLEGVERVVTIVRAMKEFAHPESKGMAPADLNKALQSTLTVARNELKYVADVEVDLGELPPIVCSVSDLNQVFLNLLVNAAHAIADVVKGTGNKGKIRVATRSENGAALIVISDTGSGIPEAIRDRVFDPFFTTKEVGRGTGQGLAIARSVVDRHKGTLTFQSEVGKGTSFYIRLPITSLETN